MSEGTRMGYTIGKALVKFNIYYNSKIIDWVDHMNALGYFGIGRPSFQATQT